MIRAFGVLTVLIGVSAGGVSHAYAMNLLVAMGAEESKQVQETVIAQHAGKAVVTLEPAAGAAASEKTEQVEGITEHK